MISGTNWVGKIIKCLNRLYKKDELTEIYNALELSEAYKRNSSALIHDFLTEFGTIWSDNLFAYPLLKLENLIICDEFSQSSCR